MMKLKRFFIISSILSLLFMFTGEQIHPANQNNKIIENTWHSLKTIDEEGLFGERLDLWRNKRLWNIAESGYLIDGFEKRPGTHPWQGEHLGKWLHAATLAYQVTKNEKLKGQMDSFVNRLLATQLPNGYMGTYPDDYTFITLPENVENKAVADDTFVSRKRGKKKKKKKPRGGWDTWTHRYNLYGLLTYEKFHPNKRIVDACRKMGDLLIDVYGEGKSDLTKYGTRQGISATTLLESIVMLYERTGDKKYLNFAEHIVAMSENNPKLRLMVTMLEKGSVVLPGDGKGYQLMANLLGYLRLYLCTGKEKYLTTVLNAWGQINEKHILVTGGPWTRKMTYNGNKECFAYTEDFHPNKVNVEGCCDATWIQLNIHLFELTGDAKYFNEAEIDLYNSLMGHQHVNGLEWCYFTIPNKEILQYRTDYHCCASSMPRGMEMFSDHLTGEIDGHLSINSLSSFTAELPEQFGGGLIKVKSDYTRGEYSKIIFKNSTSKEYTLEFRIPAGASFKIVKVNGEKLKAEKNSRGFYELTRTWNKDDVLKVEMEYEIKVHVQAGENNQIWIAFTYGPFALAQKISKMPKDEPFSSMDHKKPGDILAMLSRTSDTDVAYKIKDTGITLIPFVLTGVDGSGPRTYFKCK